jgi:hypothetical protein
LTSRDGPSTINVPAVAGRWRLVEKEICKEKDMKRLFVLLLGVVAAAGRLTADDSVPTLGTSVKTSGGKTRLEVTGLAPDSLDWLGVSFYTPDYASLIWDACHSVHRVAGGRFSNSYDVPDGFKGGTYEVALWKENLAATWVYRMEGLCGYGSGTVKDGAQPGSGSDTIPELKTGIAAKDGRLYLKVNGRAPDRNDWLGVSFYRANYADPVLDAQHGAYLVAQGDFTQQLAVPEGFEAGTYEVALWKDLLEKKEIHKLGTMRAYGSGKLEP